MRYLKESKKKKKKNVVSFRYVPFTQSLKVFIYFILREKLYTESSDLFTVTLNVRHSKSNSIVLSFVISPY